MYTVFGITCPAGRYREMWEQTRTLQIIRKSRQLVKQVSTMKCIMESRRTDQEREKINRIGKKVIES